MQRVLCHSVRAAIIGPVAVRDWLHHSARLARHFFGRRRRNCQFAQIRTHPLGEHPKPAIDDHLKTGQR